jgi:CTP-dependent riboflavin kinase
MLPMKVFRGQVTSGYGEATPNLTPVMQLIEQRTGLTKLVPGTLNVTIAEEYIVRADAFIHPDEYPRNQKMNDHETIKLQRCIVAGYKALIMRPDSHELGTGQYHGKKYLELMGQRNFRDTLNLVDASYVEVEVEGDDEWWRTGL